MENTSHSQANADASLNPLELFEMLRFHYRWWVVPAAACGLIAAAYALVAPREWRATQALIIRPEVASISEERIGRFADLSEMKTLQETILELARSQSVVRATLREVGPPRRTRRVADWPTPLDVESFRKRLDMRPPGGAEFGKTEVFYLSVRDGDQQRAAALAEALCGQLERRMQELRDQRAQGMISELERTVAMADDDLAIHTEQLATFEASIGPDLAELRNLNAQNGAQGEVPQELQAIESERRANEAQMRENVQLVKLLTDAQNDPHWLLATPSSLLQSVPAIGQLKDALVDAQIRTAGLLGSRSERHPFVVAARDTEHSLRNQLQEEVAAAVRSLTAEIELNADREQALAARWAAGRNRLSRLAAARAEYASLVASVENHTRLVEAARKNLADARARQAGARSASVISRIDGVEAGVRPVGPGRATVTAAGGVGGLLLGFGLVFLFASPATAQPNGGVAQAGLPHVARNGSSAHNALGDDAAAFGLFRGMTLEEAICSVRSASCTKR